MKTVPAAPKSKWQKTPYANLVRYVSSGIYFARVRVGGKLIRRSLKTDVLTTAKLRLADLEKSERQTTENQTATGAGKLTGEAALVIYETRLKGNASLKPRTVFYYQERIKALRKSWPLLFTQQLRQVTKGNCLDWAARVGLEMSASAFNHTLTVLKAIFEIGVENGARYDNPVRFIKRMRETPKKLSLPEFSQFPKFVEEIENGGSGFSRPCADLVRFLAFGGFRKSEAANITWEDCDFTKGEIIVRGDPETGTKNGSIRRVPMIADMRELLERLHAEHPPEAPKDSVMQVKECQKAMDRAAKQVGIARITHHDLRHLFATRCIESGVDIPTVSRWLGHKDGGALAMKVYGHLRDQHSANMAQKVSFAAPSAPVPASL